MAQTRIGFVGAGWIVQTHLRVLAHFDDVRVVAIASRRAEPARKLATPIGAQVFEDYRSMLDRAELDAVFVAVPPNLEAEVDLAVAERGIPLFTEKPLDVNPAGPERVAEEIARRNLLTCVGYQWRYLDVVDRARELLAERPPHLLVGSWLGETPGPKWWLKVATSGGQVVEQATHIFDLARFLLGEYEPVAAAGRKVARAAYPDTDIQDVTQTSLRFASGAIGSITTTSLLAAAHRVEIETVSDGLALTLGVLDHRLQIRDRANAVSVFQPESVFETPYERQNRAFIDAVQGKPNRIRSSYADALRTHRITTAATRLAFAEERTLRP